MHDSSSRCGDGRLRIMVFAGLADLAGGPVVEIDWPGGTVAELRAALAAARPALEPLLAKSAVAIDHRHAAADAAVRPGADVAILPPVSGG